MKCYGQVRGVNWQQEHYDGLTNDAATRARQLRKLGYRVVVSAKEYQVTPVGTCKMQMISIEQPDEQVPAVEVIKW